LSQSQLIECVPNFSDGKNSRIISAIAESIQQVSGVHLLHIDTGYDANRTVMTFAGSPDRVLDAAFAACRIAAQQIDMSKQQGAHPRLGAMDVCPLVALQGITPSALVDYSLQLGQRIGDLGIPVYLYEHSAQANHRKRLEQIRKGGYENFSEKIQTPGWAPDFGPSVFNEKSGATVLGVRDFLVAFNINLDTDDVAIANHIARQIRSSGYRGKAGMFQHLKAIGWYVNEYGCAQVSTNVTNYKATPPHEVYEAIKSIANKFKVNVTGSELIGLIPKDAMLSAGKFYHPDLTDDEALVRGAIVGLGLADKKKFKPKDRILDYQLQQRGLIA